VHNGRWQTHVSVSTRLPPVRSGISRISAMPHWSRAAAQMSHAMLSATSVSAS
jgi:hypothetical protein